MSQLSITSSGILEEGFQEYQVINNIITAFKFTPEAAKAVIEDGTIIRKSVPPEFAEKLADRFAKQGLKVILKKVQQTGKDTAPPSQSNSLFANKAHIEKLLCAEFTHKKVSIRYNILITT